VITELVLIMKAKYLTNSHEPTLASRQLLECF